MRICLIGFMGCGKTTLGRALAENLGTSFYDLDQLVREDSGKNAEEIFFERGEEFYRQLEEKCLSKFLQNRQEGFVLALGGGAYIRDTIKDELEREQIEVIYLQARVQTLLERLGNKDGYVNRPLLSGKKGNLELQEFIKTKLGARQSHYLQAKRLIDVDEKSVEDLVEEIVEKLKQ